MAWQSFRCFSSAAASPTQVDRVLVVDCPEDEQIRRVVARSGLTPAEVRAIMATQLDRGARLRDADDVLDNSGPPRPSRHRSPSSIGGTNSSRRTVAAQ